MASSKIQDITSSPFNPPSSSSSSSVLFFWASWHEPSNAGGQVDTIYRALAENESSGNVSFYRVEAEVMTDVSLKYNVTIVPTFILLDSNGTIVERIEGADDISRITQAVTALSQRSAQTAATGATTTTQPPSKDEKPADEKTVLDKQLHSLINSAEVMLFMKGNPTTPRCGFSRQAVELLTESNITFGTFDILQNEEVRQGLKVYSDWPTYPQLYVRGELIGGLDIMKEMASDDDEGNLADQLDIKSLSTTIGNNGGEGEEKGAVSSLEERLKSLITKSRIMVFMKGVPSSPRCGFSRQIVELLESHSVPYDAFNILEDEEVRQGLKKYSDWPTYPQLYVDGDLIGGLDIVKEMEESGDLVELLKG